jgi:hypothetical protein
MTDSELIAINHTGDLQPPNFQGKSSMNLIVKILIVAAAILMILFIGSFFTRFSPFQ